MKKGMSRICTVRTLKFLMAFLIPAVFVLMMNQSLDNDSWYVFAEGREIVQNGVYYTDQLSMHEGLDVTVQNYGFAAIFYLLYGWLGAPGIYVGMLLLNFVICFLIYRICKLISNNNVNLSLLIMVVTDLLLASWFVVTRAQMVSYVLLLLLIYLLELFIKTDKTKYLWFVPVLSLLQINLHASLWWMLVLVLIVYIIDSIKQPRLHLQGYRTVPLVIVLAAVVLVGFINPYGLNMMLLMFKSYGDGRFHNVVSELSSFSPLRNVFEFFLYLSIVGTLCLYIFGEKKNIRVRYLLMYFGFLILGLNTIKGMSQFVLTMFFPLALVYKSVRLEKVIEARKGRNALVFWGGVTVFAVFVVICPLVVSQVKDYPDDQIKSVLDAMDVDAQGEGKRNLTVYTGYDDGGYVEYRGYKAYLDPRGEVFLKKNNNKEDILFEWTDLQEGRTKEGDFLEKYQFDYIVVREDDRLYNYDDDVYMVFFEGEDGTIKVLKNKKKDLVK